MTTPLPSEAQAPQLQHGGIPQFDAGNQLLSIVPCQLTVSPQQTPAGQRLAATIRTVDTTLTLFLAADEVDNWMAALKSGRAQMNGLILPGGGLT